MNEGHPGNVRVLPLHLTVLERYMHCDDRPAYPMTFFVVLDFEGAVECEAFEEAYDVALARHPLLGAVLGEGKSRHVCWVAAEQPRAAVRWGCEHEPIDFPGGLAIDLTREPGVRIWSRPMGDGARITLQFHHACTDGIGAYRFIGDLLAAYGMRISATGPSPTLEPVNLKLLRNRRKCLVTEVADGKYLPGVVFGLSEAMKLFDPRVVPMASPRRGDGANSPVGWPLLSTFTFARSQHEQLRAAADGYQATINDLLLCELFRALQRWNQQHQRPGGRLRILMPTDMRRQGDHEIPAANLSSHALLTRNFADCDDRGKLLAGIRDETSRVKFERRGTRFADAMSLAFNVPGLVPLVCRIDPCLCTAVLSNAGDPTKRFLSKLPRERGRVICGNLVLKRVFGAPPIRRKTRLSMSIFTYLRELTVCISCDPNTFSAADSQQFLALYMELLSEHLPARSMPQPTEVAPEPMLQPTEKLPLPVAIH